MSAQRCYSCGEYDAVWITHEPPPGTDPDDAPGHLSCRNCDNGLCEDC